MQGQTDHVPPLWRCPRCGAKLVGRNMPHACGTFTVEAFLAGKSPMAVALWDRLVSLVARCGPFDFAPAKTRVAFMVRVRFLAVTALSDRGMTFHVWLRQPTTSARVFRIDDLGARAFIHWIRVSAADELDDVRHLLCDAYRIGCGKT